MSNPLFEKKTKFDREIGRVITRVKEYDTDDNTESALSSIIHRSDHDFEDKLNPFVPNAPFFCLLKTSGSLTFFCFQGVEKGCIGKEWANETKRKLDNLCKGKDMIFINNNNIDSTCLNRSKLHLNKGGTSVLIKHFLEV